jgi:Xaa-Pro aminopeptidase
MNVKDRIAELHKLMEKYKLDAYIIPSSDPHMSEYTADHWKARSWISGFTGSAGTFVATKRGSGLWTDGRYYIQAEKQLNGSGIKLFKMGNPDVPDYTQWIADNMKQGECVGFSGKTTSVAAFKDLNDSLSMKDISVNNSHDLIEKLWKDRPPMPAVAIFNHDIKFAGLSTKEKLERVREEMKKVDVSFYLISSLDDIAWLYNIRGDDVPYISVTIAYALISVTEAYIFINRGKVPKNVRDTLSENGVSILDYEDIKKKVENLAMGQRVAFDPKRTNCWLYETIKSQCKAVEIDEITSTLKAVKNDVELEEHKQCQINDGVAMVKLLIWIENSIDSQKITEIDVADKIACLRAQQPDNIGPSFSTIAAYRDHGAMMHYSATEDSNYVLENKGLMVLDSGGQYLNGTTDITRTIVFDDVTEEEKADFTLVLKSHISLASAKFLYGATGSNLDVLARKPMWDVGLDYKCGTGHGVGYCLSVHEGPQNISMALNKTRLQKGMNITIEPGIYREGLYGIRTENMVLVTEDEKNEFGQFMSFEPLTLCPISLKGININLLTPQEITWLNDYHFKVFEKLSPHLNNEEREWLKENTRSI